MIPHNTFLRLDIRLDIEKHPLDKSGHTKVDISQPGATAKFFVEIFMQVYPDKSINVKGHHNEKNQS